MSSIMHNSQQADEELAFLKRQLEMLNKDHDSLHLENVNLRKQLGRAEQSLKECLWDDQESTSLSPAWGDMLAYLNHQDPFPTIMYQMVKRGGILWGQLREQLAAVTQERDRWMEDSQRQSRTIQRLADAAEDRNKVDAARAALHAEELAAMKQERYKAIKNESAIRTLMECYQLGGCTDYERLARDLAASQASEQQLREAAKLFKAYASVDVTDACGYEQAVAAVKSQLDTTALDRSNKLYAAGVLEEFRKRFSSSYMTQHFIVGQISEKAEQLRKEAGE